MQNLEGKQIRIRLDLTDTNMQSLHILVSKDLIEHLTASNT